MCIRNQEPYSKLSILSFERVFTILNTSTNIGKSYSEKFPKLRIDAWVYTVVFIDCKYYFPDLNEQIEALKSVEKAVAKDIEETSNSLSQAKESKVNFCTSLQHMQEWLEVAEQELEKDVTDLKVGQERHKALLAEMKEHAPEIELLRAQAKKLVQKPASPGDKDGVLESLTDVTMQWQELQKVADERSKDV